LSQELQLDGRRLDIKVALTREEMASTAQEKAAISAPPNSKKVWVAGLNYDTTEESLSQFFARFGEVEAVTIMRDHGTGRSRGFGFVNFSDPSVVEEALNQKDLSLDGRTLEIKPAVPKEEMTLHKAAFSYSGERPKKIFVAGLSSSVTEDSLKEYFSKFGKVNEVNIQKDRGSGSSRGFAFVTFESGDGVERTLAGGPHAVDGTSVDIKVALPRGAPELLSGRGGGISGGFPGVPFGGRGGGVGRGMGLSQYAYGGFGGPGGYPGPGYPPQPAYSDSYGLGAYGGYDVYGGAKSVRPPVSFHPYARR